MKANEKIYEAQEQIADILVNLYKETGLIPNSFTFEFIDVTTNEDLANDKRRHVIGSRELTVSGSGHK